MELKKIFRKKFKVRIRICLVSYYVQYAHYRVIPIWRTIPMWADKNKLQSVWDKPVAIQYAEQFQSIEEVREHMADIRMARKCKDLKRQIIVSK